MIRKTRLALLAAVGFIFVIAMFLWQAGFLSRRAPLEKVTVGSIAARISGPLYIAQEQGYFTAQGLDVTIVDNAGSPESISDLEAGRLDLACCGAFNLMKEALAGAGNSRGLAILCNGQIMDLVARQDRGIDRLEDLRGKTVGLLRGTAAEYFPGRVLTFHHISLKEVTVVDVKPPDLGVALAAGKVDAVVAWERYLYDILDSMKDTVVTWPAQERQDIYWILAGSQTFLKTNPAAAAKFLRALEQAVGFIKARPDQGKEMIYRRTKFPPADWERYPVRFGVYLDQGLLLHMEDQAAWMIQNRLTDRTKIPDFMAYVDPGPLLQVDPKAVRLVLPGKVAGD
jgi:NitT/TauT family transport system substrate-binding protein